MEAITALVNTCYRLKLNLFDSSFLKMVQLLLEQDLPELQLLGTKSVRMIYFHYYFFSSLVFRKLKRTHPVTTANTMTWWIILREWHIQNYTMKLNARSLFCGY